MKRIDIREFREQGYLQEANRRFFYPLGLALEIVVDADGSERLGGIRDCRDNPEGITFAPSVDLTEKAELVDAEWERRFWARIERFRYMVQPVACPNPDCKDGWVAWGSGVPWVEEGRDRCPHCERREFPWVGRPRMADMIPKVDPENDPAIDYPYDEEP